MKKPKKQPPAEKKRTRADAVIEALPDLLALGSCAAALAQPDWPGYDTLRTAGALFFVELPLAIIVVFGGVMRIDDKRMNRGKKSSFVLLPILAIGFLSAIMLGRPGIVAVAWLSAGLLYRLARGIPPRGRKVPGFWLTYTEGDGDDNSRERRRKGGRGAQSWKVEGGVEEFQASTTMLFWFVALAIVAFLALPSNVSAEYADSVGWDKSPIGGMIAPAKALWAGVLLFGIRALGRLDFGGDASATAAEPVANIADDPILREIVSKVDAKK